VRSSSAATAGRSSDWIFALVISERFPRIPNRIGVVYLGGESERDICGGRLMYLGVQILPQILWVTGTGLM
jgi:hypothetical protein